MPPLPHLTLAPARGLLADHPAAAAAAVPSAPGCPPGVLMRPDADHRPRAQPGERLHQVFEQRCDALVAQGRADHLAVDSAQQRLSYPALDALANQLARWLLAQGVGAGAVVALLFDKSAWSYAAMLAVGKVQAAYVPLDPGFPAERIAFIAEDAGARWLLTTRGHRALAQAAPVQVWCLDELADTLHSLPPQRLSAAETPVPVSERCYTIYTSGSTGKPKGVPIEHDQVLSFVRVAAEEYGYRDDDRVYQGLTLAFDFAVEEIWVPLAVGATLLPNDTGGSLLGQDLADFLRQQRATALCCVPTLLATLDDELPALRLMIVSGEACPRDLVNRWATPGRRFLNAYGPTEATVTATLGEPRPGAPVTIGRPLPTYAILILPPGECRALPFGEEGEIAIAGVGIASGYLNREAQTRAAFIADEVGVPHNRSGRLYRTGDLGRINAQGEVEYLGRIDTQVKIRGYRIELAEIESLLLQCPGIAQAVVNPWASSPGVVELVAYYTVSPEAQAAPPTAEALAARLRAQLPPYMVPSYWQPLPRMPMLASDKADRKALPPPSQARLHTGTADAVHVPPAPGLEQALAQALAELLGLDQVSATAHFFDDLGLSSLLLARLAARLRRLPDMPEVSMRQLYSHPSVRALAAAAAAPAHPVDTGCADWPLHQAPRAAYLACGLAQLGLGLAFVGAHAAAWWHGLHWVLDAPSWALAWARAVGVAVAYSGAAAVLPVAAKWLLVGRFQAERFPVWGWRYLRFWAVRGLIRSSPVVALAGTPLYTAYLRALGARVHPSAVVALRVPPACPDLFSAGPEAVVGHHSVAACYRVLRGWVQTGPVQIGAGAELGEFSLMDVHTRLGAGARMAHAGSLQAGQQVPDGARWHGSPGQPQPVADTPPAAVPGAGFGPVGAWARWRYSALQLLLGWALVLPLPMLLAFAVWGEAGHALDAAGASVSGLVQGTAALAEGLAGAGGPQGLWPALQWVGLAAGAYLGGLLLALLAVASVPRLLARALPPGQDFALYGWRHWLLRLVRGLSNVPMFNALFGDSGDIVHYLRAIGWRLPGLRQLGSNFGMAQQHDVPRLCQVGAGTMVSDGLSMLNAEFGPRGFRLHAVALGRDCYLGNAVAVPPGHWVGDNCLLASKLMLPVQGPLREGVGLLGSPPMEIPRRTGTDTDPSAGQPPGWLAERLRRKQRANRAVMAAYLVANGLPLLALAAAWHALYPLALHHEGWFAAAFAAGSLGLSLLWLVAVDAASRGWRPLQPQQCSIYEPAFWRHERHWKLGLANDNPLLAMLAGTPLRGLLWRAMGVQVGRQLFDDGASITEKTLVRLGDHCSLGAFSTLQGHSLEDGQFKSDRLWLGDGCSVGPQCYVHYATRLGDGATVLPDAFVMKGEQLQPGELWVGNPAQRLRG